MRFRSLILAILIFGCNSHQEYKQMDVVRIGQDFLSQFNSAQQISFHNNFYDKSFTLQDLKDFGIKVDSELGSEVEVIDEIIDNKIWKGKQYYGYVRYSKYSKTHRPIKTIFAFDSNKTIYRFEITQIPDPVPSNFENYSTKTALRLPFEGAWYVASGGRSSMYNHHTELLATRYATDFIIKKGESYFSGTGRRNEDYFSFNQKVLAPGSGVIVYVENDINENKIGYKLPENAGNRVTINHENGEFSFLCHFKKGSISVKLGDTVSAGQYLGLCGNSGLSYAPHIHYHLQNSATIFTGDGLPIQFISFNSDEKYIEKGEMEFGTFVKNEE